MANGQMSSGVLVSVGGGQALRADAAAAWLAVVAEVLARFGITLRLTDSYRPYAVQVRIFNERYDPATSGSGPFGDVRWWGGVRYVRRRGASAAVPGTSNHGLGVAVDVTGLGGFAGSAYAHLAAVAPAHGWSNWAGRQIGEAWHWEYSPSADTHTPAPAPAPPTPLPLSEEDDMIPLIERTYRDLCDRTGSLDEIAFWHDAARGRTAAWFLTAFRANKAETGTVRAAYRALLGRAPESTAMIAQWQAGRSIGQVWAGIAATPEAKAR